MPRRAKYAVYVYDIPVDILQKICTTLDNDKGWKDLGKLSFWSSFISTKIGVICYDFHYLFNVHGRRGKTC